MSVNIKMKTNKVSKAKAKTPKAPTRIEIMSMAAAVLEIRGRQRVMDGCTCVDCEHLFALNTCMSRGFDVEARHEVIRCVRVIELAFIGGRSA